MGEEKEIGIKLTYHGVVYSKKNSKQIIRRKNGSMGIISNANAQRCEKDMCDQFDQQLLQLSKQNPELEFITRRGEKYASNKVASLLEAQSRKEEYKINFVLYPPDRVRRDIDNQVTTILDALVKSGAIVDDCFKFLKAISAKFGGIDKINPRAEIEIKLRSS